MSLPARHRHTRRGSISTPALPRGKRGSPSFLPAPSIPPATRDPPCTGTQGTPRTHGSRDSDRRARAAVTAATAPLPPLRALTCGLVTGGRPRAGRAGRDGEGGAREAAGTTRDRGRRRGERYVPSHTRCPRPSRACVGVPVGVHAPARDRARVLARRLGFARSGARARVFARGCSRARFRVSPCQPGACPRGLDARVSVAPRSHAPRWRPRVSRLLRRSARGSRLRGSGRRLVRGAVRAGTRACERGHVHACAALRGCL